MWQNTSEYLQILGPMARESTSLSAHYQKKILSRVSGDYSFAMTFDWFHVKDHSDMAMLILSLIPLLKL